MPNKIRSLKYNSLRTAFVLVSCLFLMFTIKNYLNMRSEKLHSLELRLDQRLQILSENLAIPLWNLDHDQLLRQLESLKNDSAYCGATIRDNYNADIVKSEAGVSLSNSITNNKDIYFRLGQIEKKIGNVEVCFNLNEVKSAIKKDTVSSIIYSILAIILIMIFINISLNKIIKPIEKIRKRISKVTNSRHKIVEPDLLNYTEIALISKTFNQMVDDLNTSDEALIKANQSLEDRVQRRTKELNEYKNNLEKLVQERILELVKEKEKAENGHFSNEIRKRNIPVIIEKSLLELKPLADIKRINFTTKYNISDPEIKIDEGKLLQVFINIISNAIKFSDKNSHIKISLKDDVIQHGANSKPAISIQIADEGQGIAEQELELIFDKIAQSSKAGGGLGLSMCKEIVESYGGLIIAKNNDGNGSTISVILPR